MMLWDVLKKSASEFVQDECSQMAAALSYYATFSLAPLLVLVTLITGIFWEPQDVETQLGTQLRGVLGADGANQIKEMLAHANRPDLQSWGSILSVLALLYGASGVFIQIQGGLNRAWEVAPDPEQGGIKNFITKRLVSVSMLLVIAFLLVVSLAASAFIAASGSALSRYLPQGIGDGLLETITFIATFALLTLLFAALYKILPDAEVKWRHTWGGAVTAALLMTALKFGFGYYIGSQDLSSSFGAAASLAVILLWVYFSGMILFAGAEFTQAWAQASGHGIEPKEGAVKVEQQFDKEVPKGRAA